MKHVSISFFCLLFTSFLWAKGGQPLLRFPAVSPDGNSVTFSYQGDIWVAPAEGGEARRLTIHEVMKVSLSGARMESRSFSRVIALGIVIFL